MYVIVFFVFLYLGIDRFFVNTEIDQLDLFLCK